MIDQAEKQRSWSKFKSGAKKKPRNEQAGLAERSRDAKPTSLGTLPIATPAERFAQVDAGMRAAAHAMARAVELESVAAEPETGFREGSARSATPFEALAPHFA
jgi:hypothetical protein